MDASPLKRLPAEIRNIIWAYALTQRHAIQCTKIRRKQPKFKIIMSSEVDATRRSLSLACRETCSETTGLYFPVNHIRISTS